MEEKPNGRCRVGVRAEIANLLGSVKYLALAYLVIQVIPFLWLGQIPMFAFPLIMQIIVMAAAGLAILFVAAAIARKIESKRPSTSEPTGALIRSLNRWDIVLIVALIAANLALVVAHETAGLLSEFALMLLCISLKIAGGMLLALWARSPGTAAILTGAGQTLFSNILFIQSFLASPDAQSQYGPEAVIYAMAYSVGNMSVLPIGAAFIYGVWRISLALYPRAEVAVPGDHAA